MKRTIVLAMLMVGCAGVQRDCSSCAATHLGGDWIVVQYRNDGTPINCWKLTDVGITNEENSDGIFWRDPAGHLVHTSGWLNRVQVNNGDYAAAAHTIGVDERACVGGVYGAPADGG